MRKLIVSMNVTLDGFMCGPNCELDWHFNAWNEEMAQVAAEQLYRADTIILGAVTYRAMARYWPMQSSSILCARDDLAFANMMNTHTKVVFSKTLVSPQWKNTRLVRNSLGHEIIKLKKQNGKHLIVYGSGKVVAALIRLKLVDEYQLWVHPVVLGKGKPFFTDVAHYARMKLINTRTFRSGVILLSYYPL